jgi:NAD/NADP transhydrogenase beta subunit
MPIIEVHNSRTVFVLKRSMSLGFKTAKKWVILQRKLYL